MGAHGDSQVKTPALDQLDNSGVRFENNYTPSPICISARAGFATGTQKFEHRSDAFNDQAETVTKLGGLQAIHNLSSFNHTPINNDIFQDRCNQ